MRGLDPGPEIGPTPPLQAPRLALRKLGRADAPGLAAAETDPGLFTYIGGEPPSAEELEARIERYNAGPPKSGDAWHNWAIRIRETGELIGHLQATVREGGRSAEIAWLVGTPWQGRGYATEAATAVVEWLTAPGSAIELLVAHVHPDNAASAKVAGRLGLTPTDRVVDGEIQWRRVIGRASSDLTGAD